MPEEGSGAQLRRVAVGNKDVVAGGCRRLVGSHVCVNKTSSMGRVVEGRGTSMVFSLQTRTPRTSCSQVRDPVISSTRGRSKSVGRSVRRIIGTCGRKGGICFRYTKKDGHAKAITVKSLLSLKGTGAVRRTRRVTGTTHPGVGMGPRVGRSLRHLFPGTW